MPAPRGSPPVYTSGWVAERLGVNVATLRTWHHRYGLAPGGRTTGGHRRYSGDDLDRLAAMQRLILNGLPTAEAARLAHGGRPVDPSSRPSPDRYARDGRAARLREELYRAAVALDPRSLDSLLGRTRRTDDTEWTWTDVLVPVLHRLEQRVVEHEDCVPAVVLLSDRVRYALSTSGTGRPRSTQRPALLTAVEDDQHVLPLHALAAALAERHRPSVLLGSVPPDAVAEAVHTLTPSAVFVWATAEPAHRPTADRLVGRTGSRRRPPTVPVVVGGPGWDRRAPRAAARVRTLADAVTALVTRSDGS